MNNEITLGSVCQCKQGRFGIITKIANIKNVKTYIGIGTDGNPWSSIDPEFIAENVDAFVGDAVNAVT